MDLAPEYDEAELVRFLARRAEERPRVLLENYLVGMFHKRVGQTALKAAGIAPRGDRAAPWLAPCTDSAQNHARFCTEGKP